MKGTFLKSVVRPCGIAAVAAVLIGGVQGAFAQPLPPRGGFAQPLVPGTGVKVEEVGDDMEDEQWQYILNLPKASSEDDEEARYPLGYSTNGRWVESALRGTPDVVRRVSTPPGGLEGSKGALLMQTLNSGIPGKRSPKSMQDDLIVNGSSRLGYSIPVEWGPSFVVRVFIPPFEYWDPRTDSSFGFRADATTTEEKKKGLLFIKRKVKEQEPYWPGMFIQFNSKADTRRDRDSAFILIRCDDEGRDLLGPEITPGWWTLGMSFTPDGRVHYYASAGVDDLKPSDHLGSYRPYGFDCERVNTMFFNVVSANNGRNWSTPWIIDDPSLYYAHRK